mmetsp:Transcript_2561/g.4721  ORF Transcript_2561/g.4721 Transcript_2561/m.4721 type:complete len:85 (+) Transcript_2561:373-627(+)
MVTERTNMVSERSNMLTECTKRPNLKSDSPLQTQSKRTKPVPHTGGGTGGGTGGTRGIEFRVTGTATIKASYCQARHQDPHNQK